MRYIGRYSLIPLGTAVPLRGINYLRAESDIRFCAVQYYTEDEKKRRKSTRKKTKERCMLGHWSVGLLVKG